jgi:hypothetical protein
MPLPTPATAASLRPGDRQHLVSLDVPMAPPPSYPVSASVAAFVKEKDAPNPFGGLPDGAVSVLPDLEFIEIQKEQAQTSPCTQAEYARTSLCCRGAASASAELSPGGASAAARSQHGRVAGGPTPARWPPSPTRARRGLRRAGTTLGGADAAPEARGRGDPVEGAAVAYGRAVARPSLGTTGATPSRCGLGLRGHLLGQGASTVYIHAGPCVDGAASTPVRARSPRPTADPAGA